jgi:pimeloyl-ACP methyl ester carboxylesterase
MTTIERDLLALTLACAFTAFPACAMPAADGSAKTSCLVPPTVAEDQNLPSIRITVAGRERKIHCRSYGDASNPVLLVAPGSLSDIRAYLPFRAFADKYRVVLWDLSGNGLSGRVCATELSFDSMVEEMHQVKLRFSPDSPVTVVGHSWSAAFAAMYCAKYPADTDQLVLMEPPGLKSEYMAAAQQILRLTSVEYCDMNVFQDSLAPTDHERLDFEMLAMLDSGVRDFFVDVNHRPVWPVWRVGGLALIVWERSLVNSSGAWQYDLTAGLGDYTNPVLIVGSSHSPIGYAFQERYTKPLFASARVLHIEQSGHRMITEQWAQLESGLRGYLKQYGN